MVYSFGLTWFIPFPSLMCEMHKASPSSTCEIIYNLRVIERMSVAYDMTKYFDVPSIIRCFDIQLKALFTIC